MYQFLRALCRACHDEVWDPVIGRFNYYNRDHEILYQEKPKLLRNEHWDPNRVSDWSMDEVRHETWQFEERVVLTCECSA